MMPSEEELYKMWWTVPVGTPVMVKVAYNAVLQTRTASVPTLENGVAFIYLIQEESKEKFMLNNVRLHNDGKPVAPFEMSMLLSARDRRTALFLALKCLAHATLEDHPKNLEMEFERMGFEVRAGRVKGNVRETPGPSSCRAALSAGPGRAKPRARNVAARSKG